jgi:snurportin-1
MSELPAFPPSNATSFSSHQYQFQYPATLLCIPYHMDLTITHLVNTLIPMSRSIRHIPINIPVQTQLESDAMDVERGSTVHVDLIREDASIKSDGLLLYFAQATYEPGTSPLSLWVPAKVPTDDREAQPTASAHTFISTPEAPLDVFERYIKKF